MAENSYSISEIREVITRLPEQFNEDVKAVTVTRHGKDVMTILPSEAYKELLELVDSLVETLEIVQDKDLMEALQRGIKDMEEGRVTSLDDAMKELGWE